MAEFHVDVRLVLLRKERIVRDHVAIVEHDYGLSALFEADVSVVVRIRGDDEPGWNWRTSLRRSTGRRDLAGRVIAVVGLVVGWWSVVHLSRGASLVLRVVSG